MLVKDRTVSQDESQSLSQTRELVLWGRSFDEYIAMFALSEEDLKRRILGVADGPADFNRVATAQGTQVVSIDPIYHLAPEVIDRQIEKSSEIVRRHVEETRDDFVWNRFRTVEDLFAARIGTMRRFLADFPAGLAEQRYQPGGLPKLDFKDHRFDLALCSHFLFLYSKAFDLDFHLRSIGELLRVATEVRIFPLLNLIGERSQHLDPVIATLSTEGFHAEIRKVDYEFQKGGNEMLVVHQRKD